MTPRLLLLTGPAAGEVARALSPDECEHCDVSMDPCSLCPVRLGFDVRDFMAVPLELVPASVLPGGEAWLVGLVLPELPIYCAYPNGMRHDRDSINLLEAGDFFCEPCRNDCGLPPRLAILAPEPPPLLVERVRAWGGEVWECETCDRSDLLAHQFTEDTPMEPPCITVYGGPHPWSPSFLGENHTWPEAVRAALGEVAP